MEKRTVDMSKEPRREQFAYFSSMANPYMGATCEVDITALMARVREDGAPVFLSFAYQVLAAANAVPELRRRIEGERVVEYGCCRGSCTVAKDDGTYAYCTLDGSLPLAEFLTEGQARMEDARCGGTIKEDEDAGELFFISCLPWLHYTSIVQPTPTPADSNVRLTWGRYVTEADGRVHLPVTVLAHHALVDGVHLGAFFRELEARVSKG